MGGGKGRKLIGATAWMARKMMRWYQLPGSVSYSGRNLFLVGRLNRRGWGRGGERQLNMCAGNINPSRAQYIGGRDNSICVRKL